MQCSRSRSRGQERIDREYSCAAANIRNTQQISHGVNVKHILAMLGGVLLQNKFFSLELYFKLIGCKEGALMLHLNLITEVTIKHTI